MCEMSGGHDDDTPVDAPSAEPPGDAEAWLDALLADAGSPEPGAAAADTAAVPTEAASAPTETASVPTETASAPTEMATIPTEAPTSLFPASEPDAAGDGIVPPPPPQPAGPNLPSSEAKAPPPMVDPVTQPRPGASTWYRSDEDRARSVYRRANPWYRRLARGIIGLGFLAAAGIGLYFGARLVQDYLERDRLPSAGAEVPEIRSSAFIVTSSAPAPELDGTLTIDTETGAFEFVGRAAGPQSGVQVVSPDGVAVFVRQGATPWRSASAADSLPTDVSTAVSYLRDDDNADDILTNRLRRGFVDLVDREDEGEGDARLRRYRMTFDTQRFADQFPLQWQEYQNDAIPGIAASSSVPVTIWLDNDDVLVRVNDEQTNWAWERLSYSDQPVSIIDPADESQTRIIQVACVSDDNSIFWQTPFASCAEAMLIARGLAVDTGVADAADDTSGDRTIARLCSTMERESGPFPATPEEAALATALVESGVCRGDPSIFTAG